MKTIVVLSGGMDSVTALHYINNDPKYEIVGAVTFNYGSKHNDEEYKYALVQCVSLKIPIARIDLRPVAEHLKSDLLKSGGDIPNGHYADLSMKRTVVPFRNGIMLSVAAGVAESMGAEAIVLGNHFGDHAIYPDCRESFITPMSDAIKQGTYIGVKIIAPFTKITKADIAKIGLGLGVDYRQTYSCYNGREKHCGKCGTCVERIEAFKINDMPDLTEYE